MTSNPTEPCPGCDEGWRVIGKPFCSECYEGKIALLCAQRDAAREAVHIFLPPGNEAMEDIIWEGQPDDALMTIRIRYGQFKRARALIATSRKDAT